MEVVMPSEFVTFWKSNSFAVVGHSEKAGFAEITYQKLKEQDRTVFPVDPSVGEICGDKTYADLDSLPEKVEALVLELPKDETESWVKKAAEAGIKDVWIHMGTDTPAALAACKEAGINVRSGTCAVMYLTKKFTYHSIHKGIMKLLGKY